MIEFFKGLFDYQEFMPHGHCYLWKPDVVGIHLISDALIVLSYYSIPVTLLYFVHKRRDMPYHWLLLMFGAFIFGCGTTHLMEIWTLWIPTYRLAGLIKLATALISVATAIVLIPIIPKALALPSLKATNEALTKTTAELSRSNKDLEQYAYAASHDLQEPLRSIGNFVQLLSERYKGKLDAEADEYIHYTLKGTQRMRELIHDLLEYSRITAQAKEPKVMDAGEAVEDALLGLKASLRDSEAEVKVDPLPKVKADRAQLAQIFQNLVGNAVKFRGKEKLQVRLSAEKRDGEWIFSVKDNGIGVDAPYHEKIFEVFKKLHSKEEYPGSGIGLAVCKKIVERHGGRIWVESCLGEGAVFYFTFSALEE